jgi:hypothetical protein
MLPRVEKISERKKFRSPVPTKVPPITITKSLGEGGKTFSINAKKKSVM